MKNLLNNDLDFFRTIHYTDCIPLFHMGNGLAPMVEVALAQVEDLRHKLLSNSFWVK